MFSKALLTTALISAVSAHQNWHQLWVNDVTPGYQVGIRMPPSNSPVTDVTSSDIACNVPSTTGAVVETVEASEGDTIKVQWDSSSHPGPITHMLMAVDDASTATGVGAGWFKIDELDYVDGQWANAIMEAVNMTHEFKLPTGLASGQYLLRSEMLALHGAQTVGGAQFYIGCAQVKITGTGSAGSCTPTIELPGAYNAEDANIYIPNVYNGFDPTNYTAPGGPVAACGAGAGSGSSSPSSTALPAAPANSTVAAVSSSVVAPVTTATAAPIASSVVEAITSSSVVAVAETSVLAPSISIPTANATSIPTSTPLLSLLPSTFATLVKPTPQFPSSTGGGVAAPTGTGTGSGAVKLYYQCGGIGWTGATACVSGASCVKQNEYYSQCLAQ
ncbi:hypothetical protein N0V83_005870 [Neocucurbitaria cava]|uniref:AA9 family lytic polysaccharide monooxygenase n=1 Tax=Neocucurbitaria cava TaxID=798079 RepID=A0A9W9CL50_9PLEO|nr:hypothetical protein N0V83_005870 [Neocucurbitaria cava]